MVTYRRTYAEINLDNLAHNIREIQKAYPANTFLCPMVKADAYGHGDVAVARTLEKLGVQQMGVCLIEEGIRLRNAHIGGHILVFGGFDQDGAQTMLEYNLTPVVSNWRQLEALDAFSGQTITIHLKFNSGMNRLGFRVEEAEKLFAYFSKNSKLKVRAVLTHLFDGEDGIENDGQTAAQLREFQKAYDIFKPLGVFAHALNSSGLICKRTLELAGQTDASNPLFSENWGLRPGLMIYGYDTVAENKAISLRPVMTLRAQVNTLHQVPAGEIVSYGGKWKASRPSVIAVINSGYADGYHRLLTNQASVLFAGQRAPVVGTVCMDYTMVDVTDIVQGQDLKKFDDAEVVLFGQSQSGARISATELAQFAKTNSYEILTSVSARVPRVYKGGVHERH